METVRIDGITYEVHVSHTPEQADAEGWHNIARAMRERKQTRHVYLRRPKGRVLYFAVEQNGRYSVPVSVGC